MSRYCLIHHENDVYSATVLAFSVIFNMNEKGEVKDSRIVHTIIKSDRRFTYEEAQKVMKINVPIKMNGIDEK